jgi:AAA+ ATPase superfamily predicted ATPase
MDKKSLILQFLESIGKEEEELQCSKPLAEYEDPDDFLTEWLGERGLPAREDFERKFSKYLESLGPQKTAPLEKKNLYTLDEIEDDCIGVRGSRERERYERDLSREYEKLKNISK